MNKKQSKDNIKKESILIYPIDGEHWILPEEWKMSQEEWEKLCIENSKRILSEDNR